MRSIMTKPGAFGALALIGLFSIASLACDARTKVEASVDNGDTKVTKPAEQPKPQPQANDNQFVADKDWGNVKGTVTYDSKDKIPENPAVTVTADKNVCLQGKIFRNEWVVDSKTRGVKNVLVWLSDEKTFKQSAWKGKIHPDLKKAPATFEIDQPTCTFAPRMTAIREETKVVFKNKTTIGHNVKIEGGDTLGPNINTLIPPGKQLETEVKARFIPISYSCTIHAWMKGWIASFKHPYFAVTDEKGNFEIKNAPPGKYRLQVWHEGYGFVQKNKNDRGIIITIKGGETTDVKVPPLKKED